MGKNVLLLSMSTMNRVDDNFYYVDSEGKRGLFKGKSQLEPGTKATIHALGKEKIDKIIILATPETAEENVQIGEKNYSAIGYYQESILSYMKNGENGYLSDKEILESTTDKDVDVERIRGLIANYDFAALNSDLLAISSSNFKTAELDIFEKYAKLQEKTELEIEDIELDLDEDMKSRLKSLVDKKFEEKDLEHYENLFEKYKLKDKWAKLGTKVLELPIIRMKVLSHCYAKMMVEVGQDALLVKKLFKKITDLQTQIDELTKHTNVHVKECIRKYLVKRYYECLVEKNLHMETNLSTLELTYEANESLFTVIDIKSPEHGWLYGAIPNVVQVVMNMKEKENEEINLYLDMQGGTRVSNLIINAVVNMLQGQGVKLQRSSSIAFRPGNAISRIKDETMSNHMFDFVSAMDEFLKYGKANKFSEYYEFYKAEYRNGQEGPEQVLIDRITNISNAIALSDITQLYRHLDEFGTEIENYKNNSEGEKEALFEGFVENLSKSYALILPKNRKATDVIRWCNEKELYQQALTVCESKFPEQLVVEGIIKYYEDKEEKKYREENAKNSNKSGYKLADLNHYFIKTCKPEVFYDDPAESKALFDGMKSRSEILLQLLEDHKYYSNYEHTTQEFKKCLSFYDDICSWRNKTNHGSSIVDEKGNDIDKDAFLDKFDKFLEEYEKIIFTEKVNMDILVNRVVDLCKGMKTEEALDVYLKEIPAKMKKDGVISFNVENCLDMELKEKYESQAWSEIFGYLATDYKSENMVKVSKNGINTSKLKPQERFIKLIQDGVLKSICYDPKEVADERKEELQGTLGKYFSLQAKIETNKDYETLAYSFLKSYSDILKSRKEELDLGILSKNKSMNIRI